MRSTNFKLQGIGVTCVEECQFRIYDSWDYSVASYIVNYVIQVSDKYGRKNIVQE